MSNTIKRQAEFDVLRGVAVVSMVMANAAPLYAGEVSWLLRAFFSIAAPIFVMMSGFMVSQITQRHSLSYFLIKGLFIFMMGALIDVFINQLVPFEGFDVLYLIGLGIPITALTLRLSNRAILFFITTIVLAGVMLRMHFGYGDVVMTDIDFTNGVYWPVRAQWECWLYCGWFPILPWLAFMLSGGLIGKIYKRDKDGAALFGNVRFLLGASLVLLLGVVMQIQDPAPMIGRHGYAEIFYPTTVGMFCTLLGVSVIALFVAHFIQHFAFVQRVIRPLGVGVLGIYILHLFMISVVIKGFFGEISSMYVYVGTYLVHMSFLVAFMWCMQKVKERYHNLPKVAYWFIGR